MKQRLVINLLSFVLILSLSSCNKNEEHIIEGRSLGIAHSPKMITIFIKDSYRGGKLEYISYVRNEFDIRDYSVEAYNIEITKDTKIFLQKTGEEVALDLDNQFGLYDSAYTQPFVSWMGAPISVKVNEEFTPIISTDRRDYILHSRELLPIYTAKEIYLAPLTEEEFIFSHGARSHSDHQTIIMVYDNHLAADEEIWIEFDKMWESLDDVTGSVRNTYPFYAIESSYFEQFNVPVSYDDYPFFLILDKDSISFETDDFDRILELISEAEN